MRMIAVVALALLTWGSQSSAQPGAVVVSSDPGLWDCGIPDAGEGLAQYFVLHILTAGSTGVSFSAPLPSCHTGAWLSDTPAFPSAVGDSQTGVTITWGACLAAPIVILTMNVMTKGTTPDCCLFCVRPATGKSSVEARDCALAWLPSMGQPNLINYTAGACVSCSHLGNCDDPLPVEPSTWGMLKALYVSE